MNDASAFTLDKETSKTVTVKLPSTVKLRDNINNYYVLVDGLVITNDKSNNPFVFVNDKGVKTTGVIDPYAWTFTTKADTKLPELASKFIRNEGKIRSKCLDKDTLELVMNFSEPVWLVMVILLS